MKKETIDMKENFVRADGVSYREAVEKCIRHYVMRGYSINDETKRLRFQVEKVLQMSMFDRQKATLKLQEVNANQLIQNIVNTFKLKVENTADASTPDSTPKLPT